jgi:hypothetical protein
MSSTIKFTCLAGSKNENPLCYLLEVDELSILLDCGWDENFSITAPHIIKLQEFFIFIFKKKNCYKN